MVDSKYFLEMEQVSYRRAVVNLLNSITFGVAPGEFLLIAGSDITGKTSLLRLCAGLIQPNQGVIRINGKSLSDFTYNELQLFRQKTGFIFQEGVLISNLSIRENIALPLRYNSKFTDTEIDRYVTKYLDLLNIGVYANERPAGLSLETKLLANVARALMVEPELLLIDELFGSLNRSDALSVVSLLKDYRKTRRLTCLATTKTVNLMASFPEETLVDCLMLIESGSVLEYGQCKMVRDNLLKRGL